MHYVKTVEQKYFGSVLTLTVTKTAITMTAGEVFVSNCDYN